MGILRDSETVASTKQVPSGPKKATTPSQIMSSIALVASTVSPLVSLHRITRFMLGKMFRSLLIWNTFTIVIQLVSNKNALSKAEEFLILIKDIYLSLRKCEFSNNSFLNRVISSTRQFTRLAIRVGIITVHRNHWKVCTCNKSFCGPSMRLYCANV